MSMLTHFKELVRGERPDYVSRLDNVSYNGLSCVQCRYRKGENAHIMATSFYTDTWLAPNPMGPLSGIVAYEQSTLKDVADIKVFDSAEQLHRAKGITSRDLENYLLYIEQASSSALKDIPMLKDEDRLNVKLHVTPLPIVTVVVSRKERVLGSCAVGFNRRVTGVMFLSPDFTHYFNAIINYVETAGLLGDGSKNVYTFSGAEQESQSEPGVVSGGVHRVEFS